MTSEEKGLPTLVQYEDFANAIIIQAADDYRKARHKLCHNPDDKQAVYTVEEVERFFLSPGYRGLTKVDGQYLLNRLKNEDPRNPISVHRYW